MLLWNIFTNLKVEINTCRRWISTQLTHLRGFLVPLEAIACLISVIGAADMKKLSYRPPWSKGPSAATTSAGWFVTTLWRHVTVCRLIGKMSKRVDYIYLCFLVIVTGNDGNFSEIPSNTSHEFPCLEQSRNRSAQSRNRYSAVMVLHRNQDPCHFYWSREALFRFLWT